MLRECNDSALAGHPQIDLLTNTNTNTEMESAGGFISDTLWAFAE